MKKRDNSINTMSTNKRPMSTNEYVGIAVIIVVLSLGLFFYLNIKNQDINFSRRAFAGLINGRQAVQEMIDWANFKAVGADAGKTYSALPDDKERADYQKAFIEQFSLGFRQTGGRFKSFINWRIYDKKGEDIIVAADHKDKDNQTILFTVSGYGRKKLEAIQWEQRR